jgi:predicted anti-sigma-YlaC factor YlaD
MIRRLLKRRRFMREHEWTHAHLSDYLDDDLSHAERDRIEEHVGMCPQCRRVLRTLRRTLERLMDLPVEPRPSVADGVIERLRRGE